MALSHLGTGKSVASTDESSEEAEACNVFYEVARDDTLADCPWPFATKTATLALVEEDPTEEWGYSYRYPSDCITVRRILSGLRNDHRQSRVSYVISTDDTAYLIYADQEDAQIEYTFREDRTSRYSASYALALSYKLAILIAPRLTKGDLTKIQDSLERRYLIQLSKSKSKAFNEEQRDEEPKSRFIRVRG